MCYFKTLVFSNASELCWKGHTWLLILFLPFIVFLLLCLHTIMYNLFPTNLLVHWFSKSPASISIRKKTGRNANICTAPRLESEALQLIQAKFHKRGYAVTYPKIKTLLKLKSLLKVLSHTKIWALEHGFCGLYFGISRNYFLST